MCRVYIAMHVRCTLSFRRQIDIAWISASRRNRWSPAPRYAMKNEKKRKRRGRGEKRTNRRRRGTWNDLWAASWTLDTRMCQNLVVEGISLVASSPPCEENATRRISGPTCTSRRPRWEDGYPCVSPMTPRRKKTHVATSTPLRPQTSSPSAIRADSRSCARAPKWTSARFDQGIATNII